MLAQGVLIDNAAADDTGALTIDRDLDDDGKPDVTVSGNDASRVLHVRGDTANGDAQGVTLDGLVIAHGAVVDANGAGILADNAALTVSNSVVRSNTAGGF